MTKQAAGNRTLQGIEGVDIAMLYRSGGGMLAVAVDEFEADFAMS